MSEILITCPHCGRRGFSERGLTAHWCKALGSRRLSLADRKAARAAALATPLSPSPMPSPAKAKPNTKHSLAVVSDSSFAVAGPAVKKLRASTAKQVAAVLDMEIKTAVGAIIAGLGLHRTKASLKNGEFTPYLETELAKAGRWTAATAVKNASHFMRLANVFLDKSGINMDAVLAGLDGKNAKARAPLLEALKAFVGEHSFNELLIKYDIKSVGLKTALTIEAAAEEPKTDASNLAEAAARAWEESYGAVQLLRGTFTEPEKLQLLTDPQQIETLQNEALEISRMAADRLAALRAAKAQA